LPPKKAGKTVEKSVKPQNEVLAENFGNAPVPLDLEGAAKAVDHPDNIIPGDH
jgi:hypothetical protein